MATYANQKIIGSNSEEWNDTAAVYREMTTAAVFVFTAVLLASFYYGLWDVSRTPFSPADFNKKHSIAPRPAEYHYRKPPRFSGRRYPGKYWGNDPKWNRLGPYQKAAAMAILETGKNKDGSFCYECALNIVHSMINRADMDGYELGRHVGRRIYQPVIEPYQYKVLARYVGTKEHKRLSEAAYKRATGQVEDRVDGATHYLVHPRVMVALQRREPCKYWSWGPFKCNGRPGANWTGYNPRTKKYRNQVLTDGDHAFLAPEGQHVAPGKHAPINDREF